MALVADEILSKLNDLFLGEILVDVTGIDEIRINLSDVVAWNVPVFPVILPLDDNHQVRRDCKIRLHVQLPRPQPESKIVDLGSCHLALSGRMRLYF